LFRNVTFGDTVLSLLSKPYCSCTTAFYSAPEAAINEVTFHWLAPAIE